MKNGDKSNYFTRYLMKKQHQIKTSIVKPDSKTQSTDKMKQELNKRKNDDTITTQNTNNYQTKNKPRHKKVQSTQIDHVSLIQPEHATHQTKQSLDVSRQDNILLPQAQPQEEMQIIPQDMTEEHIDFFTNKINNILGIIDDFERENNLNQEDDDAKDTFIYEIEPKTERIFNKIKINEYYSSPPNSERINRTNRNPSIISNKDSSNYFIKNQNIIFLNTNLKGSVISNIRFKSNNRAKANENISGSSSSSMKKTIQKIKNVNNNNNSNNYNNMNINNSTSNNKTNTNNDNRNRNNKSYNKPSLIKPKTMCEIKDEPKPLKVYPNQLKAGHNSNTKYIKRNEKQFYAGKYLKDNSANQNDRNDNNTFMSDLSVNIVLDDNNNYTNSNSNNNQINLKKPLLGIPIKNFLKIKEQNIGISKCQSDRNKSSNTKMIQR